MQPVQGDYLSFKGFNLLVIGYNHGEGIRCIPYYYMGKKVHPEERNPERQPELKEWTRFDQVFRNSYVFLEKEEIENFHFPEQRLKELFACAEHPHEEAAVAFAELLMDEAGLKPEQLGVGGSLLLGKDKAGDIDFCIYGRDACVEAINYVRSSGRFELPKEWIRGNGRVYRPRLPITMERYPTYLRFQGFTVDLMCNFGREHLDDEELEFIEEAEAGLVITDSSLGFMRPSIYVASAAGGMEMELVCYPLRDRGLLGGDMVGFKGNIFQGNGKKVAGIFNPDKEKADLLAART